MSVERKGRAAGAEMNRKAKSDDVVSRFIWAGSVDNLAGTARFRYGINHLSKPIACPSFGYAAEIQAMIDHSYEWGLQKGAQEAMYVARAAMESYERKLSTPGPIY